MSGPSDTCLIYLVYPKNQFYLLVVSSQKNTRLVTHLIWLFNKLNVPFVPLIFFQLGFTPCETEQPLQGMEVQEKEEGKDEKYIGI